MVPVHEAAGVLQARRVVVLAEAAVARQPGRERLPPAVHGDLVDVRVDDEVGLGGTLVDLEDLALVGVADHGEVVGVLGVVLVQEALGEEGVDDAVAEYVAQLVLVHPAVESQRSDDVHVVDAGLGGHVEHRLDDPLPIVGPLHLRQRQARVVEADRQLHVRLQQLGKRVHVERIQQRIADVAVEVVEAGQRLGRVDDAAAIGGKTFEAEPLAAPEQGGRRRAVDVEDESGAWHQQDSKSIVP